MAAPTAQKNGSFFEQLPSFSQLDKLAENPVDLTKDEVLTPKRIEEMTLKGGPFTLLYATELVNNEVIASLCSLAQESRAVKLMQKMQEGEILNKIEGFESENRAVLHTATRIHDPSKAKGAAQEAADLSKTEREKLASFLETVDGTFEDAVLVGIGGSDLGPRSMYLAMEAFSKPGRRVHFISNVDPDDAANILTKLDLEKTLVVVVSKSGTTLETLTNEQLLRHTFQEKGLDPTRHFAAVTGKNSPMDNPERYIESFYMWDYVGGRYSSTSMVGGVILAFAFGMEVYDAFLEGAFEMDQLALREDPRENLPLFLALLGIWNRNFLGYPTFGIMPYSQPLCRLTAHLQQCDMESNGKQVDKNGRFLGHKTGPIVWGEPGTNSQHSFFQLLHQGREIVPIEFIGFRESQHAFDLEVKGTTSQQKLLANLFAQSLSLAKGKEDKNPNKVFFGNRPNHILLAEKLTPKTVGALLALCEHRIAFQGFIWNINSFDQEGVQLGKQLAGNFLNLMQKKASEKEFPLESAFLKFL